MFKIQSNRTSDQIEVNGNTNKEGETLFTLRTREDGELELLVDGKGLNEKHKDDFLFSATGVAMQGTGIATNGKYIRIVNKPGWKNNSKGNPERLEKPDSAIFAYASGFHGKFADITEGHSIAVDIKIIPKRSTVEIDGVGLRVADDTGGGIKIYHIDNFLGPGKAVVKAWLKGGVNGTNRHVKFLGADK